MQVFLGRESERELCILVILWLQVVDIEPNSNCLGSVYQEILLSGRYLELGGRVPRHPAYWCVGHDVQELEGKLVALNAFDSVCWVVDVDDLVQRSKRVTDRAQVWGSIGQLQLKIWIAWNSKFHCPLNGGIDAVAGSAWCYWASRPNENIEHPVPIKEAHQRQVCSNLEPLVNRKVLEVIVW